MTFNRFKSLLGERSQLGMFSTLGNDLLLELLGACGFDWIMVDTEHSPNETTGIVRALQILANGDTSVIVRPHSHDSVFIKRLLDMGVHNLLIPDVRTVEEARAVIAATRYPPDGVRGVSGNSRATHFGLDPDYLTRAAGTLCVLIQIENVQGLQNLEDIAKVPGVDAIFFGAADLAASMGYLGDPSHPEVVAALDDGFARLRAIGKPSGFLAVSEIERERRVRDRIDVFGIASDTAIVASGALDLVNRMRAAHAI